MVCVFRGGIYSYIKEVVVFLYIHKLCKGSIKAIKYNVGRKTQ